MVLAVATVLAFSLRSLGKEKSRLLQGFAGVQETTTRELASDLEDRLRDVEEDARVIATLVKDANGAPQPDHGDRARTMLASFNAMAAVVRHYRSLALFGPDQALLLSAVDPTEVPATAHALMQMSRRVVGLPRGARQLTGPVETATKRYFYLYRFPVGPDVVVITIDGPRFLQSALRSVPGRIVVTDPGGAEWTGCGSTTPSAPRPKADRTDEEKNWTASSGSAWLVGRDAQRFGLPAENAVAVWISTGSQALGTWRVLLVASAGALHAREQTLARQLLVTAIGLLTAIGLVGTLIVRQQRYSAALAERLRNAEALQSLERQLIRAEKLATTGVLAAGIAHEVGTPLGIIRARAELLMDQLGRSDGRRALEAIVQQIDRISSTIRQVLDFSRAQPVEMRSLDVAAALRSTLDLVDHRFRQQQIEVRLDVDPDLPSLAADPNQFQQVLINVLLNACDACDRGGKIDVSVSRGEDPTRIRLEIRDDGAGIAPEHLLAVFDPFFTTKKRGEGTGLGLPVAASIVRNHGGEVTLASVLGEGTTVTILWPIAAERSQTARARRSGAMSKGKVLVIDDALEMASAIAEFLQRHGFEAEGVDSGAAGPETVQGFAGRRRPHRPAHEGARRDGRAAGHSGIDADVPVVIMTAFGAIDSAVEAIQRGAYHYVTKPFKLDVVRVLLERAIGDRSIRAENEALHRTVREVVTGGTLIGRSPGIRAVTELVRRVAATSAPVLVLGETGTGKELVARAIHAEGPRKEGPFVAVNCAALPEALLESELFGHTRGAFTGATQTRRGLFVEADGGTLLLDEIGDMPLSLQAKLLRVLETGEVRSIGSDAPRTTDVRIIAATHHDLATHIKQGHFRQDLFFRLNVVPVFIPALRERREDIPLLLEHFLRKSRDRFPDTIARTFSPEAVEVLSDYAWPGNVRQLENAVDRWVITGDAEEITPAEVRGTIGEWGPSDLPPVRGEMLPLHAVEQRYISWVLEKVEGNKTRAAEILQIDPSTLYRRGKQGKG